MWPASAAPARFAVIGDPIAHSLSPRMQLAAFAACGIDATYEALRTPREYLAETVARLRSQEYSGFNVTTPLKEEIVPLVDALTDAAAAVGAVNVVRRERDGRFTGH